jgi:hypothetical protein
MESRAPLDNQRHPEQTEKVEDPDNVKPEIIDESESEEEGAPTSQSYLSFAGGSMGHLEPE